METQIITQMSTLGHPQRMAIYRLLMRRYPDHVPAGEIARALDLKANTASTYLSALGAAHLIESKRTGTSIGYRANLSATRSMLGYLANDCCRGRPDLCAFALRTAPGGPPKMTCDKFNVLFICTGNSARSILAEAILRHVAGDRFNAFSAGTQPTSTPNTHALEMLRQKGLDTGPLRSKNIDAFRAEGAPALHFVFTVCNQAANEECPSWPGHPVSAHWGMPDPGKVDRNDAERAYAFQSAYGTLVNRIVAFTSLPVSTLERSALQHALDDIGTQQTH
ncbi:helix-turn-helix domain-containing protein [Actibacterium sp. 188UL27-1]|uniref:arsenate reductase/protein-tyrosine-phosphatase family protein n=1 Tax=Actibacterium sp. 188UL27-1 TaxID=2786961 RepID=UPI00195D51DE|nr:helix-turn-helix domain-containing protein [Actibacterium sp. 188UL27-1]MBM7067429.1 helix-turn-helix domain-containing protein [Actibacterium sp. 188UL27-1]